MSIPGVPSLLTMVHIRFIKMLRKTAEIMTIDSGKQQLIEQ